MKETLIFDSLIALVAGGVPAWLAYAYTRGKERRPFAPFVIVAALVWGTIVYGSFIEPRLLVTREYSAQLAPTGKAMKIAVISDTHLGQYRHVEWLEKVVAQVNAARPDLVLIAGDVVSDAPGFEEMGAFKRLEATHGAYAVLGNWDYRAGAVDVRRAIESQGVEVLTNESVVVGPPDAPLRIAGVDDLLHGSPDYDAALAEDADLPTLLLAHNPDAIGPAETRGVRLVVAGHTHGGQVRLPGIGPVPELPTELGRRYDRGVFTIGRSTLFITSGVGESGPRARLFDPPEISILHLTY